MGCDSDRMIKGSSDDSSHSISVSRAKGRCKELMKVKIIAIIVKCNT